MKDDAYQQDPQQRHSGSVESSHNADTLKRQKSTRGKGLRTRLGCRNCRARRVKCDERKPVCATCTRRGEECGYPDAEETAPQRRTTTSKRKQQADSETNGRCGCSTATPGTYAGTGHEGCPGDVVAPYSFQPQPAADLNPSKGGKDATAVDDHSILQNGALTALLTPQTWYQSLGVNIEPDSEAWQAWAASPESSWSNPPGYTAETASLLWFGLLANDATLSVAGSSGDDILAAATSVPSSDTANAVVRSWVDGAALRPGELHGQKASQAPSEENISLEPDEIILFQHFVHVLSTWLDITDPDRSFAVVVTDMALRNAGLMSAILALSARHLSVSSASNNSPDAVKYYSQTLQYLQRAMQHAPYLTSDELLATVLVISAYEMLDTEGRDWERHLKGVFWIQRSQLIHGESEGLKRCIWWAWLRQDIWAAFKERRKILSFYVLKRPCSELGFWELVNRSVFLLGQCVNYASVKEIQAGATDTQARIARGRSLWASLEEWSACFAPFNRRLPTLPVEDFPFAPTWINPPAASLAVQVYHFARLLLSDLMPALGGLMELMKRAEDVRNSVGTICGIAYCTTESAAVVTSTQCLYAARTHLTASHEVEAVNKLLLSHQTQTGWPNGDIHIDAR